MSYSNSRSKTLNVQQTGNIGKCHCLLHLSYHDCQMDGMQEQHHLLQKNMQKKIKNPTTYLSLLRHWIVRNISLTLENCVCDNALGGDMSFECGTSTNNGSIAEQKIRFSLRIFDRPFESWTMRNTWCTSFNIGWPFRPLRSMI